MLTASTVILVGLAYVGVLFAVARYGDRAAGRSSRGAPRPLIYSLSLAVYCTSWAYFGSVGTAATSGYDFLPIFIGPVLMLTVGWPVVRAIVDISKRQNITSVADFISARYGKSQVLGALVAAVAVIGVVPYIALQLKAVSVSLAALTATSPGGGSQAESGLVLVVAIAMAVFAALFGTRHVDATEHQRGLILAVAVQSVVKLAGFLAVGIFATFWLMGGIGPLLDRVAAAPAISEVFGGGLEGGRWVTMTLLAMGAILLLPRLFHVAVVENTSARDLKQAAWLFPLYLVAINIFVIPIAMAGLLTFGGTIDPDLFVLALPAASDFPALTLLAFIGGLSAAMAMVVMESVALSIMMCNNLVLPLLVRREFGRRDLGRHVLLIRRAAIAVVLVLAYGYYYIIGASAVLGQSGLLTFAAVVQFAPAFFGGLLWRKGTAAGAMAGLLAGFGVWAYTLLVPSLIDAGWDAGWLSPALLREGLFGLPALRPRELFHIDFDPLTHGVLWSLLFNLAAYVAVSFMREPSPTERLQASAFVAPEIPASSPALKLWRTGVSLGEVQDAVGRYLGKERTRRAFDEFACRRNASGEEAGEADIRALRFAEHLLASAIGAASSRLVLGQLLARRAGHSRGAISLLDDASDAIQYSHDLLQSAIDHVRQGIAVFDKNLDLISWNRQFRRLLELPPEVGRVGAALDQVLRAVAERSGVHPSDVERVIKDRLHKLCKGFEPYQERMAGGAVIEVRASRMPDGGIVVTFADMTEQVRAAEELKGVNESLERRVAERTGELVKLNSELALAKAEADAANIGKTRFIAAASHDILQPLNAARLFASSLVERHSRSLKSTDDDKLVNNLDASLEAVEEILTALLDISRLDAGATKPDLSSFAAGNLLQALAAEMAPAARIRGVKLTVMPSSLVVRSDRKLLRRIVQNLLSNAVKYAPGQRVLVGCRRRGGQVRIEVHDRGCGIPADKLQAVFVEFERLGRGEDQVPGLGLGLSIVERIARMLDHRLEVRSEVGRGSVFALTVPLSISHAAPEAVSPRGGVRPGELAGATALVIDNEPAILSGMEALFGQWRMRVMTAANAAEASAALAACPAIDVIVADYHLESEDGLVVIDRLRAEAGRAIPAILITADRSRTVQADAAARGVVHLRKPVRSAPLRAALSHLMTRAEAAE